MLNQVVLVGKCSSEVKPFVENMSMFSINIPRTYKTNDVEEVDTIECIISDAFNKQVMEYIKLNDVVGVKGSLKVYKGIPYVFVDRMTFLSSPTNKEDEE